MIGDDEYSGMFYIARGGRNKQDGAVLLVYGTVRVRVRVGIRRNESEKPYCIINPDRLISRAARLIIIIQRMSRRRPVQNRTNGTNNELLAERPFAAPLRTLYWRRPTGFEPLAKPRRWRVAFLRATSAINKYRRCRIACVAGRSTVVVPNDCEAVALSVRYTVSFYHLHQSAEAAAARNAPRAEEIFVRSSGRGSLEGGVARASGEKGGVRVVFVGRKQRCQS